MRLERMLTRSLNLCFSSGLTTTSHPGPQEFMVFDGSMRATATWPLQCTPSPNLSLVQQTTSRRINTSLGAVLTHFNTSTAVVLTVNV